MIWKIGLIVAVALLVFAWSQQRFLIYVPDRTRADPKKNGLPDVDEITLQTPDGVRLIAWYGRARPGEPTLLYFHGNANNLLGRTGRIGEYMAKGRGMFMLSYRGYGGSEGKPTEANNIADAVIAYQWLIDQGVPADQIIVYGESLGSGVAVQLAARHPVGGIILDAPYTSVADVGARIYPYLPVHALILDRYDSMAHIGAIAAPLLVVHGANDTLIPPEMGRALFDKAPEPKMFALIEGAGHADHYLFGSYDVIHAWVDDTWKPLAAEAAEATKAGKRAPAGSK